MPSPPRPTGRHSNAHHWPTAKGREAAMVYSYTQISQYLRCPRSYCYRYLDGWREKETRAAMLFGRCFERALAAFFRREDSAAALFKEWGAYREAPLEYSNGDSWERLARQGIQLLEKLARDDCIRIRQPRRNLQVKLVRSLPSSNDFVAYIDAIGTLDGTRCLLEWKTTTSRYPEEPAGLLALDPQLVCYSWMSGIAEAAVVVFVRKRLPEIQYFRTVISDEQRKEFGDLVQDSIRRIEAAEFLPRAGRTWPKRRWCGGQEQTTLVGLTSLRTRTPPMLPRLNQKRALFVLTKIDEILAWERRSEAERDTRFVELGRYLCEVRAGQYWRLEKLKSFDEFLARRFPESRRKAYYLMSIHEHLPPQARKELKKVGWTKGLELAKVARRDGQEFDCATWLHKARSLPKEEFKREVEKELTGRDSEPWEIIYFKLYKTQIPVVEQAIETAGLMLGTDKSRGYCLEMICADFLAGANLDNEDPQRSSCNPCHG